MRMEEAIVQKKFKNDYQRLAINLMYSASWFHMKHHGHLKPFGITLQQFNILRILRGQHPRPATVNLLIARMMDKMSNASRLVEKLRKKGLVKRRICKQDRRAVDVLITGKGLQLLQETEVLDREWEKWFHHLTGREIKMLNDLSDKMRN